MPKNEYDVIVIGAGPGGASCAALLAKKGLRVLVLEKNSRAGGKAMTISRQGFRYELWPVTGGPMFNSRFEELLGELGLKSELTRPESVHTLYYPDMSGAYQPYVLPHVDPDQEQPVDPQVFLEMTTWLGLQPQELEPLVKYTVDTNTLTPEQIEALDDITFHEFLLPYNIPESFYSFIAAQLNVVFVQAIDQIPASEVLKTTQAMAKNGTGYYSKGGYGRLFERCAESVENLGGDVKFQTKVNRLIIDKGQVKGVAVDQGEIYAPIVISNAGIQPTVLKLADESHFDKGYINYVKDLVPSFGLMGIRYFLSKPFFKNCSQIAFSDNSYWTADRAMAAKSGQIPEELLIFATVPSNFDPDLAPPGKQCVLASTLCPPDPHMENVQAWWDKMDEMMERIWPGFTQHVESKEGYGTQQVSSASRDQVLPGIGGECIGLGQVVGQCGRHKPSARAPVRGLFYVGCDAGGFGCGTHQAVDSAFNVSRMVHQYYQMHSPS